jgi:hypothetical protein
MGKLGKDFELGYVETILLEKIRSVRGVVLVGLIWKGVLKEHMKWMASCNNPLHKKEKQNITNLIAYGETPLQALKKLGAKLNLDIESI